MKTDSNVTWFYAHEYPSGKDEKPMYVAIIFHGDSENVYAYSLVTKKKYSYDSNTSNISEEDMHKEVYKQYETLYENQSKNSKIEFIHTIGPKFTAEFKEWQRKHSTSKNGIDTMHGLWLKKFIKEEYPERLHRRKKTRCKFSSR